MDENCPYELLGAWAMDGCFPYEFIRVEPWMSIVPELKIGVWATDSHFPDEFIRVGLRMAIFLMSVWSGAMMSIVL